GAIRGPLTTLQFNVGVDGERFIDGDAIADQARNAIQPAESDQDGDDVLDVFDPAPADPGNGLGSVLQPGGSFGTDFELPDGSSPLDPATGLSGINVSPDAFSSVYASDPYGALTSEDSVIQDGRLVVATNNSDGFGSRNENADAYGFLFNASETEKFTVSSTIVMPDEGFPQAGFAAIGMQIGDGTQASYIKFTRTYGSGQNRFEVTWEEGDARKDAAPGSNSKSQFFFMTPEQEAAPAYELLMNVDRVDSSSIWITPNVIPLDSQGNPIGDLISGRAFRVTGAIADAINGENQTLPTIAGEASSGGLFVGVYSTDYSGDFNTVRSFTARWDDLWVRSDDPTPANIQLNATSDTGVADDDGVTRLNNHSEESRLAFQVSGVATGDTVEIVHNGTVIGSATSTGDAVEVLTDGVTTIDDGDQSFIARRTVEGFLGKPESTPVFVTVDTLAPSASLGTLPGGVAVESLDLGFSETVFGFGLDDLSLQREDEALDLSSASVESLVDDIFRLGDLGGATNLTGSYSLGFSDSADVTDLAGNVLTPLEETLELLTPVRSYSRGVGETTVIPHDSSMQIDQGEISFKFIANENRRGTLFSKDHRGFGDGGHLTIRLRHGAVQVRLQSKEQSYYVLGGEVAKGAETSVQFKFGPEGMRLMIDGVEVATNEYTGGIVPLSSGSGNAEDIMLGGSKVKSDPGQNNRIGDRFDGRISDFQIRAADGAVVFSEAVTPYDLNLLSNQFNGSDQFVEYEHDTSLELETGSIGITFNTDDALQTQTIFSKDSRGFDEGGHLTARIVGGRLEIRLQSDSRSYLLKSDPIQSGVAYRMQVFFGEGGFRLLVNGIEVDSDSYEGGIESNSESLVIGASQRRGTPSSDRFEEYFVGQLGDLVIRDAEDNLVVLGM
ncbi:MAG: LamG-like jellyroll fold domain-containing protein, partial [Planctomycetota bacterium]